MDQTINTCKTCHRPIKGGRTCRRRTCITQPKCWQHTQADQGLRVKPSTIPGAGKGLFAARTFHRNEKIARYGGEHLTKREIDHRYPGNTVAQYTVKTREGGYIDARNTNAGVARYANHKSHNQGANAALVSVGRDRVAIEAEKRIQPRHEIFVDYGSEFHKGSNEGHAGVKRVQRGQDELRTYKKGSKPTQQRKVVKKPKRQ